MRTCPQTVQVLAADVAVGGVTMALIGLGGAVLDRRSRPVLDPSPASVAGALADLGGELPAGPAAGRPVVALGVAVPGVVCSADGQVRFAPNLGWQDQPLGALLGRDTGP